MKARSENTTKIDDLDLAIEMLKDLTPTARQADEVRGGRTSALRACYCGTM